MRRGLLSWNRDEVPGAVLEARLGRAGSDGAATSAAAVRQLAR